MQDLIFLNNRECNLLHKQVNNYVAEVTEVFIWKVNLGCHLPKYDTHA